VQIKLSNKDQEIFIFQFLEWESNDNNKS